MTITPQFDTLFVLQERLSILASCMYDARRRTPDHGGYFLFDVFPPEQPQ